MPRVIKTFDTFDIGVSPCSGIDDAKSVCIALSSSPPGKMRMIAESKHWRLFFSVEQLCDLLLKIRDPPALFIDLAVLLFVRFRFLS